MLHSMCWSLSLVIVKKMRHGLSKKRSMKVHGSMKKRGKKEKETPEGLEKKRERRRDSHALKRIQRERGTTEKEFPFHPPQSIHVHILI